MVKASLGVGDGKRRWNSERETDVGLSIGYVRLRPLRHQAAKPLPVCFPRSKSLITCEWCDIDANRPQNSNGKLALCFRRVLLYQANDGFWCQKYSRQHNLLKSFVMVYISHPVFRFVHELRDKYGLSNDSHKP